VGWKCTIIQMHALESYFYWTIFMMSKIENVDMQTKKVFTNETYKETWN